MKEALINYITGMANAHSCMAESLEKSGMQIDCSYAHKASADELESIIDFIEDSKEEIKAQGNREYELRILNLKEQRKELIGRIKLLEETLNEALPFLPQGYRDHIKKVLEGK